MDRFEFVATISKRVYVDGRSGRKRETYFVTIPKELRDRLKPGCKVKVVIEPLG